MRTFTCRLTFTDGAMVTGTVQAESANAQYPITYTGPTDRIPRKLWEKGDGADLVVLFQLAADLVNGKLETTEEGTYDSWAQ